MLTDYQSQRFYKHVANTEMIDMRLKKLEELVQQHNRLMTWMAKCMCAQLQNNNDWQQRYLVPELRTITGDETL